MIFLRRYKSYIINMNTPDTYNYEVDAKMSSINLLCTGYYSTTPVSELYDARIYYIYNDHPATTLILDDFRILIFKLYAFHWVNKWALANPKIIIDSINYHLDDLDNTTQYTNICIQKNREYNNKNILFNNPIIYKAWDVIYKLNRCITLHS